MPKQLGAGELRHRLTFSAPEAGDDGAGGRLSGFCDQFTTRGAMLKPRGDETVTAARLGGRNVLDVVVRASFQTRQISTDWRMVEKNCPGTVYNIRFVDTVTDRAWIRLTVESGVAV